MILAIKNIYAEKPLWKWAIQAIKYYLIAYVLWLVPITLLRVMLYFSGEYRPIYPWAWDLTIRIYCLLCGVLWFVMKNKSTISTGLNKGKRSDGYKTSLIFSILLGFIGAIIQYILMLISGRVQFFFPESIIYKIFFMDFSNELLSTNISMWLSTITITELWIILDCIFIFIGYNLMKYLFDKSILAT